MLRKISAHLAIIFGGMCFVLFVVDAIKGGAMSFINNDITKAFIAILSLLSIFNSIISLAGLTNEQRMAAKLRGGRPAPAAQPRPSAARQPMPRTQPAPTRTVQRPTVQSRSALRQSTPQRQSVVQRSAPRPNAPARPAARPASGQSRNPYASNR